VAGRRRARDRHRRITHTRRRARDDKLGARDDAPRPSAFSGNVRRGRIRSHTSIGSSDGYRLGNVNVCAFIIRSDCEVAPSIQRFE
jgi:hypothetical protein